MTGQNKTKKVREMRRRVRENRGKKKERKKERMLINLIPLSSAARLLASGVSMNTTRHLGSPPQRSSSALDSPHDKEESVASTTLGPGYDRSSSRTDVTKRTGAS
jgi:hypothetical protein